MLTVLESINLSAEYLNKKGIESPKLNAELLLAHVLNCKRLDLYLAFDRPLKQHELDSYREVLKRRGSYEPLQYITGLVEFYGMDFKVTPAALIPRPETELLVECIVNSVGKDKAVSILDIGTGSGIIAAALAKQLPLSRITAIDISPDALLLAKENAKFNNVDSQIKFALMDITQCTFEEKYDIVVSNPPYVSIDDYEELRPELKVYEPKIALTDCGDGLNFYRAILSKSSEMLNSGNKIFFEIGQGQSTGISFIMEQNCFNNINIIKDYQNIDRVITGELN